MESLNTWVLYVHHMWSLKNGGILTVFDVDSGPLITLNPNSFFSCFLFYFGLFCFSWFSEQMVWSDWFSDQIAPNLKESCSISPKTEAHLGTITQWLNNNTRFSTVSLPKNTKSHLALPILLYENLHKTDPRIFGLSSKIQTLYAQHSGTRILEYIEVQD